MSTTVSFHKRHEFYFDLTPEGLEVYDMETDSDHATITWAHLLKSIVDERFRFESLLQRDDDDEDDEDSEVYSDGYAEEDSDVGEDWKYQEPDVDVTAMSGRMKRKLLREVLAIARALDVFSGQLRGRCRELIPQE